MNSSLRGKTIFITGASRGIGYAIGCRAARDGANVVIAAKTTEPHPTLPGTIYTAAEAMTAAGGTALAVAVDIRDETQVEAAVAQTVARFGGIDILVNNASAIQLSGIADTSIKRYDLMHQVNTRGTFLCTQRCLPFLRQADNPHVLMISPPLNFEERWFAPHVAYSIAKYGMSLCVLGLAGELREAGIGVNALWPRTAIATAAMDMLGGADVRGRCRTPDIMADAAYLILTRSARSFTGQFCIDETILRDAGVTDFSPYLSPNGKEANLLPDFFL